MLNEGTFKITTVVPAEFTEEKVIKAKLAFNRQHIFDSFKIAQAKLDGVYNLKHDEIKLTDEIVDSKKVSLLQSLGFDIDAEEHVFAVFNHTVEHLIHLNKDKIKEKVKDIRKKSKRVLHKIEAGFKTQSDLNELLEEATIYYDQFDEFWSKKRKRSSIHVTANDSLTEGVL